MIYTLNCLVPLQKKMHLPDVQPGVCVFPGPGKQEQQRECWSALRSNGRDDAEGRFAKRFLPEHSTSKAALVEQREATISHQTFGQQFIDFK